MASARLSRKRIREDGVEATSGRFGVVLHAGVSPTPVKLAPDGALLITTLDQAKSVLSRSDEFVLPFDVSRSRIRHADGATKHTPPLTREAIARALVTLDRELTDGRGTFDGPAVDTLHFLRRPISRSTTSALVPEADTSLQAEIADLTLTWIDSLAAVISRARAPRRWSRTRRTERRARTLLTSALADAQCSSPAARATALAAGIQVPIAAGAWALTQLACRPTLQASLRAEPSLASDIVWETLRMYPPTWLLPRVATTNVLLDDLAISAYSVVLVSPVTLGQLPDLAPGLVNGCSSLDQFDPARWRDSLVHPGGWLPFGAGVHACPGRNLGLGQLHAVVTWTAQFTMSSPGPPGVDTSRGISPSPPHVDVTPGTRREPTWPVRRTPDLSPG